MPNGPPDTWPLRAQSQRQRGPVHDWYFAEEGTGPDVLLLHGAGGSLHSMYGLFEGLKDRFHVLALDLPGHGFTRMGAQRRSGLSKMTADVAAFCEQRAFEPHVIIGHSAGAAIALMMARSLPDTRVVGINPALGHFEGLAGVVFPAMAKLLASVPFTARLFSGTSARPERIRALIDSTGSKLDQTGLDRYQTLVSHEPHVAGALAMMAQWSLDDLLVNLGNITNEVLFLLAENDKTVPPKVGRNAAAKIPKAKVIEVSGYGHLVHEENPDLVLDLIQDVLKKRATK